MHLFKRTLFGPFLTLFDMQNKRHFQLLSVKLFQGQIGGLSIYGGWRVGGVTPKSARFLGKRKVFTHRN